MNPLPNKKPAMYEDETEAIQAQEIAVIESIRAAYAAHYGNR
jgi:hypothetical protein